MTPQEFGASLVKRAMSPAAIQLLSLMGIGTGVGAATAPKGSRIEGGGRGALIGAGTSVGVTGGGLLGAAAGAGLGLGGHLFTHLNDPGAASKIDPMAMGLGGAAAGAGIGAGLGGYAGYRGSRAVLGSPSWEKDSAQFPGNQLRSFDAASNVMPTKPMRMRPTVRPKLPAAKPVAAPTVETPRIVSKTAQEFGERIAGAYGMPGVAMQSFAPVQDRRELQPAEQTAVDKGQSRWLPEIFQSYGTKLPDMMASPGRQAAMAGGAGGLIGAGMGAHVGATLGHAAGNMPAGAGIGAGVGALGLGGLAALLQYHSRKAQNSNVEEIMRRLPPGARKRDYLSDPAVQHDADRSAHSADYSQLAAALQSQQSPHAFGYKMAEAVWQ